MSKFLKPNGDFRKATHCVFRVPQAKLYPVNKHGRVCITMTDYANPETNRELVSGRDYQYFNKDEMIEGDIVYLAGLPFAMMTKNELVAQVPEYGILGSSNKSHRTEIITYSSKLVLTHTYHWLDSEIDLSEPVYATHRITGEVHRIDSFWHREPKFNKELMKADYSGTFGIHIYNRGHLLASFGVDEMAEMLSYYVFD